MNSPNQQYQKQSRGPGSAQPPSKPPLKAVEVKFYKDPEKKLINPDLLDKDAEKQASELHAKINSAQIRRFFGEVKNLYFRLKEGRPWEELEPFVRMLKSKALYAAGTGRIPEEFCAFIKDNIDRIKDSKDFEAFVLYFEAVLGYAYGKGMVKK
ncbi:MAG TPA: type III-A CRISPR-associated protein Csm2 [Anaerohalosphaeraceae bacterium]|jgi:CRISPR-associated protein Csm2|nr:type III-A CRISPR-associated protein Csm2 [Anaerohalosphaeraceae bacterium]HOT74099.1 type III-A CRISPR-associated protein Csm2 [Anaerohalosphaeraceae bacterium]HPB94193.1 type III-A CRISPR-associated protein Csm2 [Anaerohalosphaeraceae bacterium]HQG07108.1 type III-A CRISPR-associated protein Csm2 [Anaerohalosphaeraceae bacterium]HQI08655.1 type III-A CRISPR-associated protein Csm2 [Anaerohalosphaeraceae bacterium]